MRIGERGIPREKAVRLELGLGSNFLFLILG